MILSDGIPLPLSQGVALRYRYRQKLIVLMKLTYNYQRVV